MFRFHLRSLTVCVLMAAWLSAAPLARADVHGGIEIGAKGIRALAVDVPGADADARVLLVDNHNTTLVKDLAQKKRFSPKALAETVDIVGRLATKIRTEFRVPDKRVYIVGSSGLFAPLEGDAALIESNKALLAKAILEKTGLSMDFVSVVREAELTIISVVPAKHRQGAVLLDIGSGNTKGGGEFKGAGLVTFGIPYGTVTFADRVKKDAPPGRYAETAARLRSKLLAPSLEQSLGGKAELTGRKRIYLGGGAVWALATFMKPADRDTFVRLQPADVEAFYKLVLANPEKLPNADLGSVPDPARKSALKDMERVRGTFSGDQLLAGVEILKALADAFRFADADRQMFFARNAYIGWILGYTITKALRDK